ncbi:MAG TPA: MlaD family protein [Chitinophagaceae bacterium]|nr:MlaD family protein [Chitinophagaceae bacterium]
MKRKNINTVKLGVFVTAGLLFLVLLLYMIGRNQSLFGSTFVVKARFENVQGLVSGNNVRYAGIQAGTVRKVNILSDTLIEVVMLLDQKLKPFIRRNAIATIATDGLIGNRVINITPSREPGPLIAEGDILTTRKNPDATEILRTLDKTSNDVAVIAGNLKITVTRLNNSTALWNLLNDNTIPQNIRASAAHVQTATARAAAMAGDLQQIIAGIKDGKGSLGNIIKDTSLSNNLSMAMKRINLAAAHMDELVTSVNNTVTGVQLDLDSGRGTVNALLKDSSLALKLNNSLANIEKGTDAFSQNMEALKHNFLFRGYFRKLEKQQKREHAQNNATAGRE